jgi:hypothetical protein
MPPVPVYDLAFQEASGALVAGTHGRSIWVLDHVEPLAFLTSEVVNGTGHLFPPPPAHRQVIYGGQYWFGTGEYFAPNPPTGAVLTWYLPSEVKGGVQITIADASGAAVRTLHGSGDAGFNRGCWDLRRESPAVENPTPSAAPCVAAATSTLFTRGGTSGPIVPPGPYRVSIATGQGAPFTASLRIVPDPHFSISDADRATREAVLMRAYTLQRQLVAARGTARSLSAQLTAIREQVSRSGESGRPVLAAVDRAAADVARAQGQVGATIGTAARIQGAIDGYAGLPTATQLRELEWAFADGLGAIDTLNDIILHQMPGIWATAGGSTKWPEVKPIPGLTRP